MFQGLLVFNNMQSKSYYVYILTDHDNSTFYIGVTNDLQRRLYEHHNGLMDGFTKRYKLKKLVYYECTNDVMSAIEREKQLKRWHRQWKINLIRENNPDFQNLAEDWTQEDPETSSG